MSCNVMHGLDWIGLDWLYVNYVNIFWHITQNPKQDGDGMMSPCSSLATLPQLAESPKADLLKWRIQWESHVKIWRMIDL